MPTQIPITDLVAGKWYVGRGRNANVGLWDGFHFLVICEKFEDHVIKWESYFTEESGCFQPFAAVDEGMVVEPFGTTIWDRHYGRCLEFGAAADDPENIRTAERCEAQSTADNCNLIGLWQGSTYLPDGVRAHATLALHSNATFLREWVADPARPDAPPESETGVWLHAPEVNLLILKPVNASGEPHELEFRILHYTGSSMMVRRLALASRDLPVLLYRIDTVKDKTTRAAAAP